MSEDSGLAADGSSLVRCLSGAGRCFLPTGMVILSEAKNLGMRRIWDIWR